MKTATGVLAVPHLLGSRIDLAWQNPPASDFDGGQPLLGIRIVRQERTFPLAPDDGETIHLETQPLVSQYTDDGLQPLTTYYYTIFAMNTAGTPYADDNSRTAAFATASYNLSERLYRLLPAVHQRYDVPGATMLQKLDQTTLDALNALPPNLQGKGQLRRFFYAAVAPADLMRSFAEGLPLLRNIDLARPEFLPLLAQWLGWELDRTLPVFAQRNEIRFAPPLYRSVGTIRNLQAIVTRYTGWYTQVAEFVQNIALSNTPPQLNIFAIKETPGGWIGTDAAASILGFGAGNNFASVTIVNLVPAKLLGKTQGPFALRPGMELTVSADNRIPVTVRFQAGDFADISNATASEVAAVINRTLSEVMASDNNGQIELSSHSTTSDSLLQIEQSGASLITFEGAPRGRLATFVDKTNRVRLFYETADPLAPLTTRAAEQALSGGSSSNGVLSTETQQPSNSGVTFTSSLPQGRIRYKTFRNGTWGKSYPFPLASTALAQQDPAAVELSDGRILVAWIDVVNPNTDLSLVRPLEYHLRFRLGNVSSPQRAQLKGQRREPFNVAPGTRLLFRGNWPEEEEGFEFVASDFSTPQQAKAEEVKDVLNSRLRHVIASVDPKNRTLLLSTVDTGGDKRLEIDLRSSSAAQSLGFDAGNSITIGDWGEIIAWSAPRDVTPATLVLSTDLHALFDGSVVWLFWATYDVSTSNWQIVNSCWDGNTWSNLEVVADGIGGNREPFAILDTKKRIWLFWSRRQGVGTIEDNWTLERRVYDGKSWGPEGLVTSTPTDGDKRAADREPNAVHVPNSDALRIFFRSDRVSTLTDGMKLWSLTLSTSTDAVAVTVPPSPITTDYNADYTPSPVQMPGNTLWLLFRSDRSVSLSQAATRSLPVLENRATYPAPVVSAVSAGPVRSVRVPDAGTLHRYAGSTSVVLSNVARNARQRQWDDLLAYTPQKPQGEALQDDDFYTRGTVGLYLNQVTPDSPLSQQRVDRLRPVLERFLPINVRAIVILATPAVSEDVYIDTAILDSYQDTFPYLEHYEGPGEDRIALVLPDWRLLRSNTPGDVSANPSDLTSLRHRTYSKDPPLP